MNGGGSFLRLGIATRSCIEWAAKISVWYRFDYLKRFWFLSKMPYLKDVFTTMVDMQWRYVFFAFVASFILSWLGFGVVWWLIAYIHGDYVPENINNSTFIPCILANKNFASAFLFSQETMHTIGYKQQHQDLWWYPCAIIIGTGRGKLQKNVLRR